jgi:hypothetical protein
MMRDKIAAMALDAINGVYEDSGNRAEHAERFTDAILAALPGMVPDLVWEGVEDDCFIQCDMGIHSYQLCVMDALERSCDYAWYVVYCQNGLKDAHVNTDHPQTLKAAKAAANTHHRAAIAKSAGWTP